MGDHTAGLEIEVSLSRLEVVNRRRPTTWEQMEPHPCGYCKRSALEIAFGEYGKVIIIQLLGGNKHETFFV